MSTELEVVSKALTDINAVSLGIAGLKSQYGGVVYEVATTAGMDEAKAARLAVRNPRYEVERIRKAAKAPIIALGKTLDAEAARIESELLKIEGPIDQQIKVEEARKEKERQAKIDAEIGRVEALQERVAELRGNQTVTASSGSELIADHFADLEKIVVDESFQEFQQQAQDAKAAGLMRLQAVHAAAIAHEAQQAKLKSQLEELARLQEEEKVRAATEKARRDEEARVAKVAQDAETARHNEQLKKQREEQEAVAAAERKRLDKEAADARALVAKEETRLADVRAQVAREQEALRKVQEPPTDEALGMIWWNNCTETERVDWMKRAGDTGVAADAWAAYKAAQQAPMMRRGIAVKIPCAAEIVDVLAKHYKAHPDTIIDWLQQTDFAQVKAA